MTEELKTKTALLLLAGGRSSRMGGVNKALLPFNGGTLSGAVLARLGRDFASLWVSANRDAEAFEREGFRTLPDVREGFPGPLGGIEALGVRLDTEASAVEWVMVAPCDTPFLPEDLFERLSAAAAADRAAGEARLRRPCGGKTPKHGGAALAGSAPVCGRLFGCRRAKARSLVRTDGGGRRAL